MTLFFKSPHISFIPMLLLCAVGYSQACGTDRFGSRWFGDQCQFMCHCENNAQCDVNGDCPSLRCARGWFGPQCQYKARTINTTNNILLDGNVTPCTPIIASPLNFDFTSEIIFTWLRIGITTNVSINEIVDTVDVIFKKGSNQVIPVTTPRKLVVTNTIMDIHAELGDRITALSLTGSGVTSLCSIHVSGGRNVALKQNTTQSSTFISEQYDINMKNAQASNAVDGNTDGDYTHNSCTHTGGNANNYWTVILSQPVTIQRYKLYNRNDGTRCRLQYFQLESNNSIGDVVQNYHDKKANYPLIYTILSDTLSPVTSVSIKINTSFWPNGCKGGCCPGNTLYLTLCEVEIFGGTVCLSNMWGRQCEHRCKCANSAEKCYASTGMCPSGCAPGSHGIGCAQECSSGTYGVDCLENCSSDCQNQTCQHVDGKCDKCIVGRRGDFCENACKHRSYGAGCNQTCSDNCVKDLTTKPAVCKHTDGQCLLGCLEGYTGAMCEQACEHRSYGAGCNQTCSDSCVKDLTTKPAVCKHTDGQCLLGCLEGYTGAMCEQVVEPMQLVIIVVSIVLVLLLVLAVAIGIVLWRRRRKSNNKMYEGEEPEYDLRLDPSYGVEEMNGEQMSPSLSTKAVSTTPDTPVENIFNNSAIPVEGLNSYLHSHSKDFFVEQFRNIPNSSATTNDALHSENKHKNRYKNICAYDHSRVHLESNPEKKQGDYYNASFVGGYDGEKFIASQGPNKAALSDFIRMIWEQKVDVIVMLTKLVEESKVKCERYWPEENETEFGEIKVRLATTQVLADYTVRQLHIIKVGQPIHYVTQFHFTSWPDKGVPETPWALVDFEQKVDAHPTTRPLLVHCSAGVGRTGTFIALKNVMKEVKHTRYLNFDQTLRNIRQDRIFMIQTAEQYQFLHKAVQVALLCQDAMVTTNDINERMTFLQNKTVDEQTNIEQEFRAVCELCVHEENEEEAETESSDAVYFNNQTLINRLKNRFSNILPNDAKRVHLSADQRDYINAVFVPSMSKQRHHLLTQIPLPSTVEDFWQLVTEYNVSLILAFDVNNTDETFGDYLPGDRPEPIVSGQFEVSGQTVTKERLWEKQNLNVHTRKDMENHHVNHLQCTKSDLDAEDWLAFINEARSMSPPGQGRTLYMCRNGADQSGFACVMTLLLNRVDHDHYLTVPLVVGEIKSVRPQVIPTLDQYRLLYDVLKLHYDSSNVYMNYQPDVLQPTPTVATDAANPHASKEKDQGEVGNYINFIPVAEIC